MCAYLGTCQCVHVRVCTCEWVGVRGRKVGPSAPPKSHGATEKAVECVWRTRQKSGGSLPPSCRVNTEGPERRGERKQAFHEVKASGRLIKVVLSPAPADESKQLREPPTSPLLLPQRQYAVIARATEPLSGSCNLPYPTPTPSYLFLHPCSIAVWTPLVFMEAPPPLPHPTLFVSLFTRPFHLFTPLLSLCRPDVCFADSSKARWRRRLQVHLAGWYGFCLMKLTVQLTASLA